MSTDKFSPKGNFHFPNMYITLNPTKKQINQTPTKQKAHYVQ